MARSTGGRVYVPATATTSWQYGLQSQSTVMTGNTREAFAGVDIDIDDCYRAQFWDHECGEDVQHTITVQLAGTRTGTDPNWIYTVTATATVDSGGPYTVTITMPDGSNHTITTGGPAATIYQSGSDTTPGTPASGSVTISTEGASQAGTITQAADTGAVTPAAMTLVITEQVDPNDPKDTIQPGQDWLSADSFTVYAIGPPCTGADALNRAQQRATNRLIAGEWAAVERTILQRVLSMSEPETPAGTTAVSMEQALAVIEYGMRDYGGPGVIHAPRQSYGYWQYHHQIVRNGPRLETAVGTGWAFGRGYWSMAPDGAEPEALIDPTQVWVYGTGAVRIWRSDINTPGNRETTFDWRANASRAIAERSYTVAVQCPYVAVLVDLTQ